MAAEQSGYAMAQANWDQLGFESRFRNYITAHMEEHRKYIKGKDTMTLFEYVIFYAPKAGGKALILVPRTEVLAKCEDQVKTLAARAIPEDYLDKLDEVTVKVRPFLSTGDRYPG